MSDKIIPLVSEESASADNLGPADSRRIENLALTDPINTPEHARKKIELRARLKSEHDSATKARTVTTREEIAIKDAAYWTHPPELRTRYAEDAERKKKTNG